MIGYLLTQILKLFLQAGFSFITASRDNIQAFIGDTGLSVESRNVRLTVLKKLYLWALIQGEVLSDPTLGIEYLRKPKRLPKTTAFSGFEHSRVARERLFHSVHHLVQRLGNTPGNGPRCA